MYDVIILKMNLNIILFLNIIVKKKNMIISIDGNIGSGKSTLIKFLTKQFPDFKLIPEPVEDWLKATDKNGKSILELFYGDKSRWGYTFQNFAYITRVKKLLQILEETNKKTILITERSILTDKYIFAKMLYESGDMTELEWKMYNTWFDVLLSKVTVDAVIYVNTKPEKCKKRITKRARVGEENISIDYLNNLDKYHTEWLSSDTIPILTIDGNVDFITDEDELYKIINNIEKFIDSKLKM